MKNKPTFTFLLLIFILVNCFAFSQTHQRTEIGYKMLDLEKEGGFMTDTTCYLVLDSIMNDAGKEITFKEKYTKEEAIDLLGKFHKIIERYRITYLDSTFLYSKSLIERKFQCTFYAMTYLTFAERFNLPIYSNFAPQHIFIEWYDNKINFYWETTSGGEQTKEYYLDYFKISKESINKGCYLNRLSIQNSFFIIYWTLGYSFSEIEDYIKSVENYTKTINLNHKYSQAYCNRGISKNELKDYQGALYDFKMATDLDPNDEKAFYNFGKTKDNINDYKGAIQCYSKAITINSKYILAYNGRGISKSNLGDNKGAIIDFTKAIEINPNFFGSYYNRGMTRMKLKDYVAAVRDYTMAIEINPKYIESYFNRGNAKMKLKDYKEAVQDYTNTIEINPKYIESYFNRGLAKVIIGDNNGACEDWKMSLKLGFKQAMDLINEYCK
jgi:tetratricopeptide (TPR) repeat protein